MKTPVINYKFK